MASLRVAAAQIDCVVGDIDGNVQRVLDAYRAAVDEVCDLVVFPELTVTGYPPEDLLHRDAFVARAIAAVEQIAAEVGATAMVLGHPALDGGDLYNAASLLARGEVVGSYYKQLLPNYAVFDEQRYFVPGGEDPLVFDVRGVPIGISVCEDIWSDDGPVPEQAEAGARVLVNLNASPYYRGRLLERELMLSERAAQCGAPIVYCNMVGGQDDLVFDGASLVFDGNGALVARARQFVEDLLVVDLDDLTSARLSEPLDSVREVYEALVLGTRDYVRKTGFTDVAIGLSGGIDSSIVAAVAVDALGAEHVHGVLMPSRYSSEGSVTDALALATNLGIDTVTVPIEVAHAAFESMLAPVFDGTAPNLAEENMQARIRGNIMMSISNKFNWMVLTTGNKSEMAVGYATLYGDMAGGFAVLKDVPKTLVYELANLRNRQGAMPVIPKRILDRPPTAELKPNQKDEDSLPPYPVLDPILKAYVEEDRSIEEIIGLGFTRDTVAHVVKLVDRSEYKRRQAPVGIKITHRGLGKDRRMPITNGYRSS